MNFNVLIAFLLSFFISLHAIKSIIKFSLMKGWGDAPTEDRKIHKRRVPNLGGLGVFVATMVAYFAFSDYSDTIRPDKLFSISILLFFVGLRDDVEPISPKVRMLIEFLSAIFIIYITDLRVITLWGIFGIQELPIWASYVITSIFIVGCINAYNLIDGLDGLLGTITLLGAVCFGILFELSYNWLWTLLCVALSGSLLGFLSYNWHPAKVFMGNGGALFLGVLFSCFALRLMQLTFINTTGYLTITSPHTIAFSIIAIPIIDMITVFGLRIAHKKSPFEADTRHIHHRIISMGLKHNHASYILILMNILIILFAYFIQPTGALRSLIFSVLFAFALEGVIIYVAWFVKKKQRNKSVSATK